MNNSKIDGIIQVIVIPQMPRDLSNAGQSPSDVARKLSQIRRDL